MKKDLGIIDLLKVFGFDETLKTKLVRHRDAKLHVPTLIRDGWFELYQSLQAKPIFHDCDQIVSFLGEGGTRARLLGVYQVKKKQKLTGSLFPADCPYPQWRKTSKFIYTLERQSQYESIEERAVVEWGSGTLAWHQHLKNKPVIEIQPKGRLLDSFTDYLGFSLSYQELRELSLHARAHPDWVSSLSAVAGVYLILAETTGHHYVGSAYGTGGIWSRWKTYAVNGHGNNGKLEKLLESDAAYPDAFRFSVLQVLPKTTTAREVIRWESQYKEKLGSRTTGLNIN